MMNDKAYNTLQQRLDEMQASHARFLKHLPGMAYRCAVDCSRDYRLEYRMVFASKGCERVLNLSVDEVMRNPSNTVERMTHEEDLSKMRKAIHDALAQRRSYELFYRVRLPSDEIRWIWDQGEGVFDDAGACTFLEGIMMDVSAQKLREIRGRCERISERSQPPAAGGLSRIIGTSPAMRQVCDLIVKAARTDASVILYGETGVGKDLAAKTIHEMSGVRGRYIPVNCAAIPEQLLESEFFGHVKGAFSGATGNRPGYLAAADNGTLFLDEIAELPLGLQVKLLRALESKTYTPVGANEARVSNFRLISATNRNLSALVKNRAMRADFFYRIHVLPIVLPPLRARREDIPLLAEDYTKKKKQPWPLPKDVMQTLIEYCWPGNVRELHNTLENYWAFGTLALALDTVCPDIFDFYPLDAPGGQNPPSSDPTHDLPAGLPSREDEEPILTSSLIGTSLAVAKDEAEKQRILLALEQNGWKKSRTAAALGITLRTLQRKLKKYAIGQASKR